MSSFLCLLYKSTIPRTQNRLVGSHKSALSPFQRARLAHTLPGFQSFWDTVKRKMLSNKNKCELQNSSAEISASVLITGKSASTCYSGGSLFLSCCQSFFQFLKAIYISIFTQSKHILLISSSHSLNSSKSSDLIPFLSTSFFLP